MAQILAVIATVPGREVALETCLQSLRPQVTELRVICHDVPKAPACVLRLADSWTCEPDIHGANDKMRWADRWEGMYLACDDDLLYPPDYAATMLRWVRRFKGKALVTGHGRILNPRAKTFQDVKRKWPPREANDGAWLNYPGACALGFDTRLGVPSVYVGKNNEEPQLARWAQRHRVPIWLVPHPADWLTWLLGSGDPVPTIWHAERKSGFVLRNAIIAQQAGWSVYRA